MHRDKKNRYENYKDLSFSLYLLDKTEREREREKEIENVFLIFLAVSVYKDLWGLPQQGTLTNRTKTCFSPKAQQMCQLTK